MRHAVVFLNQALLLVEQHDHCLRITINRPEQRNALSLALLDELAGVLAQQAGQPDLKCVVLTGAGERCFAAGGDLKELDTIRSTADTLAMSRRVRSALDQVRQFPVPVIAALNGLALGGGAELAMACDLRIAAPHAELGFLQAQLNVTTAWGGGIDLLAILGPARSLALLLEARRIPAVEALELGLVQKIRADNESLAACVARFIAPLLQRPVQVLQAYKTLALGARLALHERLAATEESGFVACWTHADHWSAAATALAPKSPQEAR